MPRPTRSSSFPRGSARASARTRAYRRGYSRRMPDRIRVACVQMTSRADKAANLETADRLVARAAATGADVVVLPEKWNVIGSTEELHAAAEPLDGGESVDAM